MGTKTRCRLSVPLLVVLCAPLPAQVWDSSLTIRVESSRVLVPVNAIETWTCVPDRNHEISTCTFGNQTIRVRHPDDSKFNPFHPDLEVLRAEAHALDQLPPLTFRLYEDGQEQEIEKIERITSSDTGARRDNLGQHFEFGDGPRGIWSSFDVAPHADLGRLLGTGSQYYIIAYQPPRSPKGSCHNITVTTPNPAAHITFRDEYCNVPHEPSDPLQGTAANEQLLHNIAVGQSGGILVSAQSNYFYTQSGETFAQVDVEFPSEEVTAKKCSPESALNLLVVVFAEEGRVIARHSDFLWQGGTCRKASVPAGKGVVDYGDDSFTPARYDAQMNLPAGAYKIAVAISQNSKFGVTEVPLTIDDSKNQRLKLSSIALCNRSRQSDTSEPPVAEGFVPLISQNYEFTPAADHNFHPDDPFMVYFELYEPSSAGTKAAVPSVQFQLKITNTKTGHVALDTGEMDAAQWMQPGKSKIPVSMKLGLNKLPAGNYRIDVQGSDSNGTKTPVRTAEFSIVE